MSKFLRREPLQLTALTAAVATPDRGAIATFVGVVRDHKSGRSVLRLEYSAYEAMAERECGTIVAEAESRWPVRVALAHRVGRLALGDAAVMVVAAAAHRGPAFDACRHVIEEVKRRVPIWKREWYADGTVTWVDPTAGAESVPAAAVHAGSHDG